MLSKTENSLCLISFNLYTVPKNILLSSPFYRRGNEVSEK